MCVYRIDGPETFDLHALIEAISPYDAAKKFREELTLEPWVEVKVTKVFQGIRWLGENDVVSLEEDLVVNL